jgi:hypothetical protein
MPLMKLNNTRVVPTTSGHTIVFKKGEPVYVPQEPRVIEACLAVGAEFVETTDKVAKDEADAPPPPPVELSTMEQKEKLDALFAEMMANQEEHREHFTALGRPNAFWVSSQVGFTVTAKELEQHWVEFKVKSKTQ